MNESHVAAYLARIGAARPIRPDAAGLRELQRAHLGTVSKAGTAISTSSWMASPNTGWTADRTS